MKYRRAKIRFKYIFISALCLLVGVVVLELGKRTTPTPYYARQIAAVKLMKRCIDSLKTYPLHAEAELVDPERTNLIGIEYSPITTTLGDLSAKRASTSPDFAALIVRWFSELKLQPGDVIAVGCSGSFPGLIISTLCAAEVMDLQPIIIPSLGASSYGANRPDFTYLDMENLLYQKELIHHRSVAASLGGAGDVAAGLAPPGPEMLKKAVVRNNLEMIILDSMTMNVQRRAEYYERYGAPQVFVNIGGAQINIGDYDFVQTIKPGLNYLKIKLKRQPQSMIEYFAGVGVPIIHLLNIRKLVLENGLNDNSITSTYPGKGMASVYFMHNISFCALFISLGCVALGWGILCGAQFRKGIT